MTDPALDRAPGAHEPESPAAIAGRLRARAEYRRKVARSHDRAAAAEFYWPPKSREEHERARDHLLAEARDLEEAAGRLELEHPPGHPCSRCRPWPPPHLGGTR